MTEGRTAIGIVGYLAVMLVALQGLTGSTSGSSGGDVSHDLVAAMVQTFGQGPRTITVGSPELPGQELALHAVLDDGVLRIGVGYEDRLGAEIWVQDGVASVRNLGTEIGLALPERLQPWVRVPTAAGLAAEVVRDEPKRENVDVVEAIVSGRWVTMDTVPGASMGSVDDVQVIEEGPSGTVYSMTSPVGVAVDLLGGISPAMTQSEQNRLELVVVDGEIVAARLGELLANVAPGAHPMDFEGPPADAIRVAHELYERIAAEAAALAGAAYGRLTPTEPEMIVALNDLAERQVTFYASTGRFAATIDDLATVGFEQPLGSTVVLCVTDDGNGWAAVGSGIGANLLFIDHTRAEAIRGDEGGEGLLDNLACSPVAN